MITMDPNETLRVLREAVAYWQDMPSNASDAWRREVADAMAEHAEALDAWLTRGGFLPDAWRRNDEGLTGAERREAYGTEHVCPVCGAPERHEPNGNLCREFQTGE
jgi:acyl-CoA reductase-like NAD-dependent aldehyde dehydrogenase